MAYVSDSSRRKKKDKYKDKKKHPYKKGGRQRSSEIPLKSEKKGNKKGK